MSDQSSLIRRIHFTVKGRVQGVGFRYWTQNLASELQLSGWVKNQYDGSVEGEAQGAQDKVQRFAELLHQGPGFSRVEDVHTYFMEPKGNDGFHVRF
jgi:acylphosphatase